MTNIGINGNSGYNPDRYNTDYEYRKKDIDLEDISILYTTEKTEEKRSDFDNSFIQKEINDSQQGKKFLESLINNKQDLMSRLNLTDEQYDTLACISLALASQETGMGEEKGYDGENTGIGSVIHDMGKFFSTTFLGDSSASSGLTQMKIYDFMQQGSLPEEYRQILIDYEIKAKDINNNNLYDNPDKAAIATMVVLKDINDHYDIYTDMLKEKHQEIAEEIAVSPEQLQALEDKGNELINDILDIYNNASDQGKIEIRTAFKMWLLAQNGSIKGQKDVDNGYNEEENLEEFNKILVKNNPDFEPLTEESLNFIRYALTADDKAMNPVEYMAYAWNKGMGTTGMQLDRTLADKIGTILYNPEDFDNDQFTRNVETLTEMYANQSVQSESIELMIEAFLDEDE